MRTNIAASYYLAYVKFGIGLDDLPKVIVVDPAEFFEGFKVFLWKLSIVLLYKGNAFVTLDFSVANFMCSVG